VIQALRSYAFFVFELITVAPFSLLCLLWAPLPLHWRYRLTVLWPRLMIWTAWRLCGVRWQVEGWERLNDQPVVLLCKHQSTWETMFLISHMPRELVFVFKRELLRLPFFGWGIGLLKMISIDRSQGRDAFEQVVAQGIRKLAEGRWPILFPEGTRTAPGSQGRYKSGGARLAIRAGVPVVPIAVNSGDCWARGSRVLRPGLITLSIGPAIPVEGRTADEVTREVEAWIETEMRRLSPHRYTAPWSPADSAAAIRRERKARAGNDVA
jgi:1-acyl-sn-glycerol-3-phosphate acyltransferase